MKKTMFSKHKKMYHNIKNRLVLVKIFFSNKINFYGKFNTKNTKEVIRYQDFMYIRFP